MLLTLLFFFFFFFNDTATTEIYTLSLHDALPISFKIFITVHDRLLQPVNGSRQFIEPGIETCTIVRSEEHTSELQSRLHLVCRLLLEKKKKKNIQKTQMRKHRNTIITQVALCH